MQDRVTLSSAEAARLIPLDNPNGENRLVSQDVLRASIAMALESVTTGTGNSYNLDSLDDRQEIVHQRRRQTLLRELEAEEDPFLEDRTLELELIAGAHLDELHSVVEDVQNGAMQVDQHVIDDMVGMMTELRNIMPELPRHIVTEIKQVARPLKEIVADYQNRIVVS